MNIYNAILNVMSEIGAIGKGKKNIQQGFNYRGIDDVMNALQPLFTKHRIFISPEVLEHTREERTTSKGGILVYSICKVKYTFFADDGSNIHAIVIGEGMDSGDKSSNKAMSIAMKYACFQVFCIATEEMQDPDKDAYDIQTGKSTEPNNNLKDNQKYKCSKGQIAEIFKLAEEKKSNENDFDMFKLLDDMAASKSISSKFPYADKEKKKINWTLQDYGIIKEQLLYSH